MGTSGWRCGIDSLLRPYSRGEPGRVSAGTGGGEEFVLLLARTDGMAATLLSSRLRAALISKPLRVGDKTLVLSFSAGVVEVCQGQRDTSAILMRADKALYDAKRTGRGKRSRRLIIYKSA